MSQDNTGDNGWDDFTEDERRAFAQVLEELGLGPADDAPGQRIAAAADQAATEAQAADRPVSPPATTAAPVDDSANHPVPRPRPTRWMRAEHARRRRQRLIWSGVAAAGILAIAAAGWWLVGFARDTVAIAAALQPAATEIQSQVAASDWPAVAAGLPSFAEQTGELSARTSSVAWRVLESLPRVGTDASALAAVATSLSEIASAGADMVPYAQPLLDGEIRRTDGSIDVELLSNASPALSALETALSLSISRLGSVIGEPVDPRLRDVALQLRNAAIVGLPPVRAARELTYWVPPMLGADGPRDWLVLYQNPAEARGTGGFIGGYSLIETNNGTMTLLTTGTSSELAQWTIPTDNVPEDTKGLWGDLLANWNTFNLSPDFPFVARLASEGMKAQGVDVSGVIALDPEAIAALLTLTGPVTYDGVTIDSTNAAGFLTQGIYLTIPDNTKRDAVTVGLINAAFDKLLTAPLNFADFSQSMAKAVSDGGVRIWSTDNREEEWLSGFVVGGVLPTGPSPTVAVAFNNAAGNKNDAYVSTAVEYEVERCESIPTGKARISVSMLNKTPVGLDSDYFGRNDVPAEVTPNPDTPEGTTAPDPTDSTTGQTTTVQAAPRPPKGSTKMLVHIYGPVGSRYASASLDGQPTPLYFGKEATRPVWWTYVELPRGEERTLTLDIVQPTDPGATPTVIPQSMVIPEQITIRQRNQCPTSG